MKVIGVPPDLHDKNDLKSRTLFEKCVGRTFRVVALENVAGLNVPLIRLDVGHVLEGNSWEDTIWIEPQFVEALPR